MSAFLKTLVSLLLLHLSEAAPGIQPLPSLSRIQNLTNGPAHCTNSPAWFSNGFDHKDCKLALHQFLVVNVTRYEERSFEFLAPGAGPIHSIPTMPTPIRITSGSCAMVITMLSSFPGRLPGVQPQTYRSADIASFRDIYWTAFSLMLACTDFRRLPGWSATGGRDSIGVFFWEAGSYVDGYLGKALATSSVSTG